ncbi:unnamed protein product [Oppiella nova]|uniref:Uncharacterized protein n=1 Tax=Oppiella nova TaxID=334625 RepID=A0A7R9LE19_9ACAR|nr:unnamed protein product [Oppiella nova]CAG2162572.1 unnamed protein product [Oppiella nova]
MIWTNYRSIQILLSLQAMVFEAPFDYQFRYLPSIVSFVATIAPIITTTASIRRHTTYYPCLYMLYTPSLSTPNDVEMHDP